MALERSNENINLYKYLISSSRDRIYVICTHSSRTHFKHDQNLFEESTLQIYLNRIGKEIKSKYCTEHIMMIIRPYSVQLIKKKPAIFIFNKHQYIPYKLDVLPCYYILVFINIKYNFDVKRNLFIAWSDRQHVIFIVLREHISKHLIYCCKLYKYVYETHIYLFTQTVIVL